MDTILAFINKQNIENVPLQKLVGNNPENVDVNFIRNYGNNGYGDTHKYRGSLKSSMCKYSIDPTRSRRYKYLSSQIRVPLPLLSMH